MEAFYTKDGKEVVTLAEMADALETMSEEDFTHHVSPQNNDVAIWVEDVHKNEELAKALGQTAEKDLMIKLLREVSEGAEFPEAGDYHPSVAVGKEDVDMHNSYNDEEEWNAAKEAAHPDEEIENPLTGETDSSKNSVTDGNSNLSAIANQYNGSENSSGTLEIPSSENLDEGIEDSVPLTEPEKAISANNGVVDEKQIQHPTESLDYVKKMNPKMPLKDKLIFGLIGFIIGLIIGYGISLVMP